MDKFTDQELQQLMEDQGGPCVSLYLPTHPVGEAGQQDPICIKNLLRSAEEVLADQWMGVVEARDFLQPVHKLSEAAGFWEKRDRGMALFLSAAGVRQYRLPLEFTPLSIVGQRFHVAPLLPLVSGDQRFYVLTLSENRVRLFSATPYGIDEVEVPGLPTNMEEALNYSSVDRGVQVHSPMRRATGQAAPIYHGNGGVADTEKDDLLAFFRQIDAALKPALGQDSTPLLLAGVGSLLPIYREANTLSTLVPQELPGNWDHQAPHQIREAAWAVMRPWRERQKEEAIAKYQELIGSPRISADLHKIVEAAHDGKIETLFIDTGSIVWGGYRASLGETFVHDTPESGDEDLLNLAAVQTMKHRGQAYAVPRTQIPGEEFIAATFRF